MREERNRVRVFDRAVYSVVIWYMKLILFTPKVSFMSREVS